MRIKKPFTDLEIKTADTGFYAGNSIPIALISKGIMVALVHGPWCGPQMPMVCWAV